MAANELRNNCVVTNKEDGQSSAGIKDGDEWIISIMEEKPLPPQDNKIHKVAPQLRKDNNEFFDPRIVSIGPYHHDKPELEEMENWKTRMASAFVVESEVDAHEFRNKFLEVVSHARNCYLHGSTDAYDDEAFAHMMFVDGCFLLYMIDKIMQNQMVDVRNEFLGHLGSVRIHVLLGDLILVENQLPFLVLQTLMSTRFPEDYEGEGLIKTFIDLIFMQDWEKPTKVRSRQRRQNGTKNDGDDEQAVPLHFLELARRSHCKRENVPREQDQLLHCSLKPPSWSRLRGYRATKLKDPFKDLLNYSFRSATELKARGIHFRPSTTFFLNDFNFTSRCLFRYVRLPPFRVGDMEVCSYISFMNSLINGADDVIELQSHNIIHNFLGTDEEVAKLFNTLAAFVVVPLHGPVKDVNDQIQEHYNSKRKTWTAQLLHNYFSTPWTSLAFFAVTFALVRTFIQTFFPL